MGGGGGGEGGFVNQAPDCASSILGCWVLLGTLLEKKNHPTGTD